MKKSTLALGILAAAVVIGYPTYNAMFSAPSFEISSEKLNSKFSHYSQPEHFICAQDLKNLMDDNENVVVIGALNPMKPDAPIEGSFTMWRDGYSAKEGSYEFDGMSNTTEEMEKILSSYGATPESTIVVYAATSHHDAARLFWQIEALGHKDIRYLDGGLNAWVGADLPTGNANPTQEKSDYQASQQQHEHTALTTLDMVIQAQNNDEWVIIDTRGNDEFNGTTTVGGAFGPGTIPNSIHINWTKAVNEDTTLKSVEELQALYGDVIKGKKVIAYCQSGVRSAHTTMILQNVLGAEEVYNYDGSWIEYSHAHYEEKQPNVTVINGQQS